MTVSPNRRLLALAERYGERPTVTVYDLTSLKKRKVLSQTEAGTKASVHHAHLERCTHPCLIQSSTARPVSNIQ